MELAFVIRQKTDKTFRVLSERTIWVRVPHIGEFIHIVSENGKSTKKYRILEVSTYLWSSGDMLVVEGSSKASRSYGEIVVEEVSDAKVRSSNGDMEQS